jgi:hypothetical protein
MKYDISIKRHFGTQVLVFNKTGDTDVAAAIV